VILATDVHYGLDGATAAGVAFEDWCAPQPARFFVSKLGEVQPYRPVHFYERELPCLLRLLQESRLKPETILVDGHVYLDGYGVPGLGKYLFDALEGGTTVVGVAKTAFHGIPETFQVLRGASRKPLYVTCAGADLVVAKAGVCAMAGGHRIPFMLRLVDQLCRGEVDATMDPTGLREPKLAAERVQRRPPPAAPSAR
jgi:deoxyribonuclease V